MSAPRKPTGAMSVAMVAEHWGTSDTFVYDLIKAGQLEHFKLGGKLIRVRAEAVDAYERRSEAAEPVPAPVPEPARADAATIGRLLRAV